MRSILLLASSLGGCLMGPYANGGDPWANPELRRGNDSVVLCDNGGFVAKLGASRLAGMQARIFPDAFVGVIGETGERAFLFSQTADGYESVELGAGWTHEENREDLSAQDEVAVKCTALEQESWFGVTTKLPEALAVQKMIFPFGSMEECVASPSTPAQLDPDEYCHDRLILCPDGSWQASGGFPGANDIARFAATYDNSFGALSWADTGGFGQMTGVYRDGTLTTSTYRDWQLESHWDAATPEAIGFRCPP
jgi:hypothetical protein